IFSRDWSSDVCSSDLVQGKKYRQRKFINTRCVGPEKLERRAFVHHVKQQERQHKTRVIQIAAFTGRKENKQVIQPHHNHGGVIAATQQVAGKEFVLQGIGIHKIGRNLKGALGFYP